MVNKKDKNELPKNKNLHLIFDNFDILDFNQEFLILLNQERTVKNIHPLSYHSNLQRGVKERAEEKAKVGTISHTRPNGENFSTAFDYLSSHSSLHYLGENIASRPFNNSLFKELTESKKNIEKFLAEKFYQ